MSYLENLSDGEYETIIAATAYAITTLEEEEDLFTHKKTVEGLTRANSKIEHKTARTSANWSFKWPSSKEAKENEKQTGEESASYPSFKKISTFTKKYPDEKIIKRAQSGKETTVGTKAKSTKKPAGFSPNYRNWDEDSNKHDKIGAEVAAWEKGEMIKAKNRYEKMMSVISVWEAEKKEKAKVRMEKKQEGPEHKQAKAWKQYNNDISRINAIAGNARALEKERMQNDEMKIRGKAVKIRSTGKLPSAYCSCF